MDISISTTIFQTSEKKLCGFDEGLAMCAQAGFKLLELSRKHGGLAEKRSLIDSLGMSVWSVHGTLGGGAVSADEALRKKTVEDECARMEDAAVYAPCPYVVHYLDRVNDPNVGMRFRESIEALRVKAEETGLLLAVETAPYKPKINERYPDSREIAGFVRWFDSPHVQLCIDLNHSNLNEDLIEVCENCSGLIANIHVSDNHGVWEDHLPPGEGIIDFSRVFRALSENGYAGPCNIECHVPDSLSLDLLSVIYHKAESFANGVDML